MASGESQYNAGVKAYAAGEALAKRRRVKLDASGDVVYADAGDEWIGITEYAVSSGDDVGVRMRTDSGTFKVTAAGAFSQGDVLYGAADGKVDDAEAGPAQFIALEAASADGDIVEALPTDAEVAEVVTGGAGGITAADLVYVSAESGGDLTVLPAQATSSGKYAQYVCPNAIAASAKGVAMRHYLLDGVDTSGGSSGDPVYLSDGTAGGWTLTKPTVTDKVQIVGRVAKSDATTGSVLFMLPGHVQITHNHTDDAEGGELTSPHIITDISDTNGNEIIKIGATASAVNEITVTNAATGNHPSITATGGDTNINLVLGGKGTGIVDAGTKLEADAYSVGGTDGADFNGAVTNITVVKGIVTAAS